MTVQEVMSEVRHLSLEDRLQLLELLTDTLREEWRVGSGGASSLARLRGALKSDDSPPTDAELSNIYTNHLLEKYT
jgi:hypothetical protein